MPYGFTCPALWQLHVFIEQLEESRCNSERDDISASSPPTGITICSSKEHRQKQVKQTESKRKNSENKGQ